MFKHEKCNDNNHMDWLGREGSNLRMAESKSLGQTCKINWLRLRKRLTLPLKSITCK